MSTSKKTKLAKGRLDTFYHLAKEHGFRSRASFKLIQLNKKYGFLDSANSLVDLCAAPGGWLQVAQKQMPSGSVIIGVDLQDIRPIRDVISFTDDITKPSCIRTIQKHLKDSKVDVVLHDGAPNMGSAWNQDAYSQVDLTLKATKCATLVLKKGGWYITKVFRSEDYNSLLWVFNQLFQKVEATKPMASRNASAEIYVVCRGYLAPAKLDPRLLDSRFVFKQDDLKQKVSLTSMTKIKKNRSGYETDGNLMFKKGPVSIFLNSEDPVQTLADHNAFEFDAETEAVEKHAKTNAIIKAALNDLKVLNKNEFKLLLKWRSDMRAEVLGQVDEREKEKAQKERNEVDSLTRQQAVLSKREKRERKKELARKRKLVKKLQLKMHLPGDKFADHSELFNAASLKNIDDKIMEQITDAKLTEELQLSGEDDDEIIWSDDSDANSDDEETTIDKIERDMDLSYQTFLSERKKRNKSLVEKSKLNKKEVKENHEYEANESDEEMLADDENEDPSLLTKSKKNPLMLEEAVPKKRKVDMWYQGNELFKDVNMDELGDSAMPKKPEPANKKIKSENGKAVPTKVPKKETDDVDTVVKTENGKKSPAATAAVKKEVKKENGNGKKENGKRENGKKKGSFYDDEDDSSKSRKKKNSFEVVPEEPDMESDDESSYFNNPNFKDGAVADEDSSLDEADQDTDDDDDINNKVEALAIATAMIRKKARRSIEDDMFSRYTFNDDELPDWFTEHEEKYIRPNIPITKSDILEMKRRYQEINARPMKKVAEALARKKKRSTVKTERAKEKANAVAHDDSLTPGQKISQVNKIMKKANQKQGKEKVYVVGKKSAGGTNKKRKHVTNARVRLVDKRMKKESRSHSRAEKAGTGHVKNNKKKAKRQSNKKSKSKMSI